MLANALVNVGGGRARTPDKQAIYLRYIDELTPSHMMMLAFLINPRGYCKTRGVAWPDFEAASLGHMIARVIPELSEDPSLLETVTADLARYGLADAASLNTTMSSTGLRAGRGTPKGNEFIEFVSGPFKDETDAQHP